MYGEFQIWIRCTIMYVGVVKYWYTMILCKYTCSVSEMFIKGIFTYLTLENSLHSGKGKDVIIFLEINL